MIKKFFKDHPIHKKIVPHLDLFYFLQPMKLFSIWIMVCIGMYLALFVQGYSPQFISNFNYKVLFLFSGISMISCSFYIQEQIDDSNDNIVLSYINKKHSNQFINSFYKIFLCTGVVVLIFVNWVNCTIGLLLILLNQYLLKKRSYFTIDDRYIHLIHGLFIAVLMFASGWGYINVEYGYKFFNTNLIFLLIPYLFIYISIFFIVDILNFLESNNSGFINSPSNIKKNTFLICVCIFTGFVVALNSNDPLASISIITSFPFFLYALVRSMKKDFQRAFMYPLGILIFFSVTIFPYLFIGCFLVFYLSKYYNWHRFNIHSPTFLVEND